MVPRASALAVAGRPNRTARAQGRPVARQRAPWGSISRAQVVGAALELIRDGGYEQMTVRNLAARLGVGPMSLYRHVRDKDDLLDEVVDLLLADAWRPRASTKNWRPWVTEAAEKLRRFLVSEPAALHVYLAHPVVSPAAVERMNAMMGVLRDAGFTEASAKRAYASVHTYTLGFAALEASRERWVPPEDELSGLVKQLAAYTAPRQFSEGLRFLLEGLEARRQEASAD